MIEDIHKRRSRFIIGGSVVYLIGMSGLMLRHNIWFSPDQFFIFAMVVALILGKGRKFLQDWAPILLVFLSYEFFKGALPAILKFPVHAFDLIEWEKMVFGSVLTIDWQRMFYNPLQLRWYDFYLSIIYMSFWVFPLIFAFYVWVVNRPLFRFMTLVLFIGLYATFITATLYPAMPPWMAAEKELLPPVHRILYNTTAYLTVPGALPTFYAMFRGNVVAAMPSMHAELPTMILIFAFILKNKVLIFLAALYVLSTYISIVYLGEHYLIDGLAGFFYAIGAFWAAKVIGKKLRLIETTV